LEGSSVDNGIVLSSVIRLDECLGSLGLGHDQVWVGLGQGVLQFLELYGCQQYVSSLATLPIVVKSPLVVSPDGDDGMGPWHLQNQVGIVWNCHKLGECRLLAFLSHRIICRCTYANYSPSPRSIPGYQIQREAVTVSYS
jgi:hypothetical protein